MMATAAVVAQGLAPSELVDAALRTPGVSVGHRMPAQGLLFRRPHFEKASEGVWDDDDLGEDAVEFGGPVQGVLNDPDLGEDVAEFAAKMEKKTQSKDQSECRWISWLGELASTAERRHQKISIDLENHREVMQKVQSKMDRLNKKHTQELDAMKQMMQDLEVQVEGLT